MKIIGNRVLVKRIEQEKKEGFETVAVQDDFIYRGKIVALGEDIRMSAQTDLKEGSTILFAKYSPDTHEIDIDGEKCKFVAVADILAVV